MTLSCTQAEGKADMIETITIDTEQWAVINRSEFVRAMDRFIRKESAEELLEMIIAAATRPEAGQQSDPWVPSVFNYDRSIHSNPDAKAWADLFVQTFPGLAGKHDLMLGWFANAMMAMHDHMARRAAPRPVPADKLEYLCDLVTSRMLDAAAANNHSITLALEPVRDGLSALLADLLVVPPQ